jgi:glycosyltransferase involved in cell wall biosynthesis
MPAWNAGRWIEESIESVLNQTFQEWELLILLDIETHDNSATLINKISDPRVRLVSWPHEGFVKTLNGGLNLAGGKWIGRLDADDVAAPDWLEKQVGLAEQDDSVVLVGGAYLEESLDHWEIVRLPQDDIVIRWRRLFGNVILHSGILYSRAAALRLGGYDATLEVAEDFDLWWRMGQSGKFAAVPEVVVRIRKHSASMSMKRRKSQLDGVVCVLEREIERILGVKPEPEMVRSMLHVRGWSSYYPLERPKEQVWAYILKLYAAVRDTAPLLAMRDTLDSSELDSLLSEVNGVLESGLVHRAEGAGRLYEAISGLAPRSFSLRQRVRYGLALGMPGWVVSGIRGIRSCFRRLMRSGASLEVR